MGLSYIVYSTHNASLKGTCTRVKISGCGCDYSFFLSYLSLFFSYIHISDDDCNIPEPQARMIFGNFVYPPQDSNTLNKMCNYLKRKKRIPVDIPHNLTSICIDGIPKAFIPIESRCHECDQKLKGPLLLPKNAKVLTMNGVLHIRVTIVKICLIARCAVDIKNSLMGCIILMIKCIFH